MELDCFGPIVENELRHHNPVWEISINIFLGAREWDAIDHLVYFSQLLLIHIPIKFIASLNETVRFANNNSKFSQIII